MEGKVQKVDPDKFIVKLGHKSETLDLLGSIYSLYYSNKTLRTATEMGCWSIYHNSFDFPATFNNSGDSIYQELLDAKTLDAKHKYIILILISHSRMAIPLLRKTLSNLRFQHESFLVEILLPPRLLSNQHGIDDGPVFDYYMKALTVLAKMEKLSIEPPKTLVEMYKAIYKAIP